MNIKPPYLLFLGDIEDARKAKTASGIYYWKREHCVAQYRLPGCAANLELPDMTIQEAAENGVKTLIIGLTPVGGDVPDSWLPVLEQALKKGLDIASGMHIYLNDNPRLSQLAKENGCQMFDVRRVTDRQNVGTGRPRTGKRLLTVGTDCGSGKKFSALAIEREMKQRKMPADFRATGQTGILIAGSGVCIDSVIADFISGAAESLSPDADEQHWDVIEGQGSLFHPAYAGVSLGLLHGSQPDALVICHDATREYMVGLDSHPYPLPKIEDCIAANISAAKLVNKDVYVAGVCVNCSGLSESEAATYMSDLSARLNLPVCDPVMTGVSDIVDFLEQK